MFTRLLLPYLALFAGCLICAADERVCLTNGFCLQANSHTGDAEHIVFRIGAGSVEFSSKEIAKIERADGAAAFKPDSPLPQPTDDPQALVARAAESQGVDVDFVRSVAKIESDFRQESLSKKGATGLMQIMPATAKDLGINADAAQENALGGAKYLRSLLVRYHFNSALTLAAYNAGPGAVERFGGVPPFGETRAYIVKVTREYDRLRRAEAKASGASIVISSKPTSTN